MGPAPTSARFTAMFAGRVHDSRAVVYCVANCKELSKSQYSNGASVVRVDRGAATAARTPVKRTSAA